MKDYELRMSPKTFFQRLAKTEQQEEQEDFFEDDEISEFE